MSSTIAADGHVHNTVILMDPTTGLPYAATGGGGGGGGGVTPPTAGASTQVAAATAATTLLASNAARKGATITNDSTASLFILLGAGTVTAALYTVVLPGNGSVQANSSYYELPYGFTGAVTGIWSAANGAARTTELT